MESEEGLKQQLEELQKQVGKKLKFKEAVSTIKSLLCDFYPSASPSLRKSFYTVVCRVAIILRTRYTAPGFWLAGLGLFEQAESLVSDSSEKKHLRNCISQAKEQLHPPNVSPSSSRGGYLFEGHLTVDPEPPEPLWLRQSNFFGAFPLWENVYNRMSMVMYNESRVPKVYPASEEVVAKLPVITITEEILARLGQDAECAICKENLVVDDKMQELPCKHIFHPPCLKSWLDGHKTCPICRHELQVDDRVCKMLERAVEGG